MYTTTTRKERNKMNDSSWSGVKWVVDGVEPMPEYDFCTLKYISLIAASALSITFLVFKFKQTWNKMMIEREEKLKSY